MSDLLVFVLVLGGLILGHELGHFIAARLSGVKVQEFGIGMPPRILTLFEVAGTKVTLNLLPLGGFVRPAGEDDPSVPGGLAASSKRTRAFVLLAGSTANFLLAYLAFVAAFKFAAPDPERVLVTVVERNTPASQATIQTGDLVLAVDDQPVDGILTLQQLLSSRRGAETEITLERQGQIVQVQLVPRSEHPEDQGPIGIVVGNPTKQVGWIEAFTLGGRASIFQANELLHLPSRLISGEIRPDQARISGLKGMYDMLAWAGMIDRSAQRPFVTLNLIGLISISLGLANLLPIPALDGGRLLFVAAEAVLGRRISPRHEGLAHAIGFALLLALLVYINLQDFLNPIDLPR